jgi:hypothetical protein
MIYFTYDGREYRTNADGSVVERKYRIGDRVLTEAEYDERFLD